MMGETAVKVEHLWKTFRIPHERRNTLFENIIGFFRPNSYETFTVLKDINLEVERGECIGIIGDNGSGKSTLLKIIAKILRPTSGFVKVFGKLTPFLELGVGFQPELSVRENIRIYATIMGLPKKVIDDRIDDVIRFAGLERFEDAKLKNLSSGMQVRLAFSTAIQTDPDILLVDEVLAVGDMEFQQKCFRVFEDYRDSGVTILFVSHDLNAVRMLCDRTLLLSNGERVDFGDTNSIIDKYIYKTDVSEVAETSSEKERASTRKEIEIVDVKFVDKYGCPNENFVAGDPLRVRIFFDAHGTVRSPVFGIIFYHGDTYCYGTTTEFKGSDTGIINGKGYVDFIIPSLPFLQGRFEVTVAVASHDYSTQYDWHDRRYAFNVHNPTRDLGMMLIEGTWSLRRDA